MKSHPLTEKLRGGGVGRRKERAIYVSHAYIYEPLQSKISVHKEK